MPAIATESSFELATIQRLQKRGYRGMASQTNTLATAMAVPIDSKYLAESQG